MQSLSSLSSLAALGWRKTAKNIFRFTLSSISGAVPITLVTSQGGGVVDWGDGTTTTLTSGTNSLSHTYTGYSSAVVTVSEAQRITQLTYNASTASLGCTAFALPRALTYLSVQGSNTLSGDVSGLPRALTYLSVQGSNTLSGNVSGLPSGLTFMGVQGSNTLSGDVSGLPRALTYLSVQGSNTLSGNVSGLPRALTILNVQGSNTLSGNVSGLPSGLTVLYVTGSTTLSGNVSGLPSGLTTMNVTGSNTLSGDVSGLPSGLTYLNVQGYNTLSTYTSRSWPTSMRRVQITPVSPGGLPATAVDQLLIDLAAYATTWTTEKNIALQGTNAPRTSASDAAVATLQGRGVAVTTN